jgi:hypothetical protein
MICPTAIPYLFSFYNLLKKPIYIQPVYFNKESPKISYTLTLHVDHSPEDLVHSGRSAGRTVTEQWLYLFLLQKLACFALPW